jgi:hypothetical protein
MRVRIGKTMGGKKWHVMHDLARCQYVGDIPVWIGTGRLTNDGGLDYIDHEHPQNFIDVNFNDADPDDGQGFTTLDDRACIDRDDICRNCLAPLIRAVKAGRHHKYEPTT